MSKTRRPDHRAHIKHRNPYALIGKWRSGAGTHDHPVKKENRLACRGRVYLEDYLENDDEENKEQDYVQDS